MHKFPLTLKVKATSANVVKTSDGDFQVSHNQTRQLVGKQYDAVTKSWRILPYEEVVCVNSMSLNYYASRAKEKSLLPANQETAELLQVSYTEE